MRASLTNDEVLASGPISEVNRRTAVKYLNESPRHAIVIDSKVYVLRGAGEDLNNFYYGPYPAEDPGDAEGGDLTASEAIASAMELLRS